MTENDPELQAIRAEFVDEAIEGLTSVTELFVELEADPSHRECVESIFRVAHSIKGNAAYFDLLKIRSLAHGIENVLDAVRKETLYPASEVVSVLLSGVDELSAMLERARQSEPEVADEEAFGTLLARVESVADGAQEDEDSLWAQLFATLAESRADPALQSDATEKVFDRLQHLAAGLAHRSISGIQALDASNTPTLAGTNAGPNAAAAAAPPPPAGEDEHATKQASPGGQPGKTMRIAEHAIDDFLVYVGELVMVSEMYQNFLTRLEDTDESARELRRINDTFDELSKNLQDSIMDVRKVPLEGVLRRAPRLIRDVASESGKTIRTRVEGGRVSADKSLIDLIEAPLVHMARNAADHGVESPAERKAAGKDPTGSIEILVEETGDELVLTVRDDGRGLDYPGLTRKAVSIGLLKEGAQPTEREIIDLLFASGVSTAETVTDISGRGVGMNVVKQNIDAAGGKISVQSTEGQGSEFSLRLPKSVTTQILPGFVFKVGHEHYIVPTDRVVRCLSLDAESIVTVVGSGECLSVHDRVLPLCRLRQVFGDDQSRSDPAGSEMVIVVDTGRNQIAMVVDEVVGMKRVVLKSVEALPMDYSMFSGGAVMGDTSVAMILDVDRIAEFRVGTARRCDRPAVSG